MFKYLKKANEISILSFLTISLFFLIPYIFYYIYSIKEIYVIVLFLFFLLFSCEIIFFQKEITFYSVRYSIIIFIFVCSILISGITNSQKNNTLLLERFWIWSGIFFFIIFFINFQKNNIKKIIDFIIFFNLIITIIGIFQYFAFKNFLDVPLINTNTFNFRIYSIFGNPDNYAIYLVTVMPFIIFKYMENKKLFFLFFLLLNLISLFLTKSLSGIICLSFQIVLYIIFFKEHFKNRKNFFIIFFIILIILSIISYNFINKKSDSINIRKFLWESTILMIKDYSLFGVGARNFRIFTPYYQGILYNKKELPEYIEVHDEAYAHNDYIQIFSEQGVIGFFTFLFFLFYPVYKFLTSGKKNFHFAFFISILGILIFAFFNFPFSNPIIIAFYIISGFVICGEDIIRTIKINYLFKTVIFFIVFLTFFLNLIFLKNFYERYYLIQFFSYQLAKGNYENANNYILKYKKIIKNDYQLNFYSGAILNALKKYEDAKAYFENAIKLFPYFSSAYYNLGNAKLNNGELENAIYIYEKLLKFNPTYKPAYNNLATAYIQKEEIDKAMVILNNGLKLDKNEKYLNYNLALCYYIKKEYFNAQETLDFILEKENYAPALELKNKINRVKK